MRMNFESKKKVVLALFYWMWSTKSTVNSVDDDPFHPDNWLEEDIENHGGCSLRSGKLDN